ncbi:MAG: hypothetical protein Q7T33_02860 [Dehalococcoidia bacterium]|nr:hypothetical protein [Dehalococcoidia bacterium]
MRPLLLGAPLLAVILLAACSSDDEGGGKVNVVLREWAIDTDVSSLPEGDIEFEVKNEGPDEDHEMVIIRTDLAPDKLPIGADGSVDEKAGGVTAVKEIQEFEAGRKSGATFTLDPGKYVLICNRVDERDGEKMVHYQKGMRTAFTVTAGP